VLLVATYLMPEDQVQKTLVFEEKHALPNSTNWLGQFDQLGYVRLI
jgi:hypothetical protein